MAATLEEVWVGCVVEPFVCGACGVSRVSMFDVLVPSAIGKGSVSIFADFRRGMLGFREILSFLKP